MFASGPDGAPRPVLGAGHEPRADGVVQDVGERVLVVPLVVDHPRREPFAEERAAAAVARVVLPPVVALVPVRGAREVFGPALDDRVVVGAHQAVDVPAEPAAAERRPEEAEEEQPVAVVAEEQGLVDAVRRYVEVAVRKGRPEDPRHRPTVRRDARRQPPPWHFLPTSGTASRAKASVRPSPGPAGPRRDGRVVSLRSRGTPRRRTRAQVAPAHEWGHHVDDGGAAACGDAG
jgi:hypothetical protein